MNPITQRSTTSSQQNGVGPQAKNNAHKAATSYEASTEKQANERLMCLLVNFLVSQLHETRQSESLTSLMGIGPYCYGDIEEC